jgi:hypothetical protein
VVYNSGLFPARFAVSREGVVEMLDDDPVLPSLPAKPPRIAHRHDVQRLL